MWRWLRRLLYLIIACGVLFLAAGLAASLLISGSAKDRLVSTLGQALGVPVSVESARFDFWQWVKLRPAVSLEGIAIGNLPGFRGTHLIEAKKLSAEIALGPLFRREVVVRSIEIDEPRILVETNAQGATNVEALLKRLSAQGAPADPPGVALVIDELRVRRGEIVVAGSGPLPSVSDLQLRVRGFSGASKCRLEAAARLFGGRESGFRLEGHAGPFSADALPLEGSLWLKLTPGEIPAGLRRAQFGDLLKAPGARARVNLEASVVGDLYGTLAGPAKLVLTDVMVGRDQTHRLRLAGEAPGTFTATKLTSELMFHLRVSNGRLRLGDGQWAGGAEIHWRGSRMSGSSRGAIRGVDINDLLGSFTTAADRIQGVLEIPSYTLEFAGRNADEIRNSLRGSGQVSISQGRLMTLDLLATIEQGLTRAQGGPAVAKGTTPFSRLAADVLIGNGRLDFPTIVLESPGLRCSGNGTIGFDHSMRFDLETRLTGGPARTVNALTRRPDLGEATLPVTIAGTVGAPQVRPDASRGAGSVAEGLIRSPFKKKK